MFSSPIAPGKITSKSSFRTGLASQWKANKSNSSLGGGGAAAGGGGGGGGGGGSAGGREALPQEAYNGSTGDWETRAFFPRLGPAPP